MVIVSYLDTSAAMKLLVEEQESAVFSSRILDGSRILVSSWLLHTELHCAAGRRPEWVSLDSVTEILDNVLLVDLTRGDLVSAGTLAPLRTADAIHLAAAIRLGVDELASYDTELQNAAHGAGLPVFAPR